MNTKFNLIVARNLNQLRAHPEPDELNAIIKFMEERPDQDLSEHFHLYNGGTIYNLDKLDTESIGIYCPSTDEVFSFEGNILERFKANKKVYLLLE